MKICLIFVFVLTNVARLGAEIPDEVSQSIKDKEDSVNKLANATAALFQRRQYYLRRCQCSRHSCSSDTSGFECTHELGNVEDVCGKDCPGRNINFKSSAFRTPPNTDIEKLSPRVKESICLYANLEPSMKRLVSPKNLSWIYFASADGVMRIYPSAPKQDVVQNEDNRLGQCRVYDPRVRPWFIGASTRPKDIVFVIDRSISMNDPVEKYSSETRWQVTRRAVATMLGSLTSFDYVNVVAFNDDAVRLDLRSPLRRGTTENLEYLINRVQQEDAKGGTYFDRAFREAFNILSSPCNEGTESESCSGCHKIILFLTDGRDASRSSGESISATEMLSNIEQYQRQLRQATYKRATIFTFSIGSTSDDSIPRQIACAHSGSWSYIGPDTDVLTTMNSYFHFLTQPGSKASPIWINPYKDDGGLGQITTVAKPVYSQGTKDLDGIFLGVVGLDVSLNSLLVSGVGHEDVLGAILKKSNSCYLTSQTPCQLQVHRKEFANRAICADNISPTDWTFSITQRPTGDNICYKRVSIYYKLFSDKEDWSHAKELCQSDGGQLVVIESEAELAFVAGVSSPDGSWIGARRASGSGEEFEWIDSWIPNTLLKNTSASWGISEPSSEDETEQCVLIDRRGASGNLNDEDCSKEHSFICEYSSDQSCSVVVNTPSKGYFEIPSLSECVNEEQALKTAGPTREAEDLSTTDVMCPLGSPKTSSEVMCCEECRLGDDESESEDDESKSEDDESESEDDESESGVVESSPTEHKESKPGVVEISPTEDDSKRTEDDSSDIALYIGVLAAVVVLLCCVTVSFFLYCIKRRKEVETLVQGQSLAATYQPYTPATTYQPIPSAPFLPEGKLQSRQY